MTNMNALGYFMDYCNRNAGPKAVAPERFRQGMREILDSREGRFDKCCGAEDVLRELGWE